MGFIVCGFFSFYSLLSRVSHSYYSTLLGLCFLPAVPLWCCSPLLSLPTFLSVFGFPASFDLCLSCVCSFDWFVCSGTSRLLSSLVFGFLTLFLLGRFFLSSVCWPCVVLVHLLRNSVEYQFLRDGVLPLGRVISCGFSWGGSGLVHLCPLIIRPLPVLVDGSLLVCFCSWLGGLSSASVRYFGVPLLLFLLGVFRLPVWAGFLSFRSLLLSFAFQVLFALSASCLSAYLLSLRCVSCLFYSVFPCL